MMTSRAFCFPAMVGAVVIAASLSSTLAQEKKKNQMVVRYVAHQEDGRFRHMGKPVMLLAVEQLGGGRPVELIVPNRDMNKSDKIDPLPQVLDNVRSLKRGDVIKIELDDSKPRPYVVAARPYKLKEGESEPNAYVFENSFRKEDGRLTYTAVVLSRFDEHMTFAVQQLRDKDGDMASDAGILDLLQKLKTGDVVEAEIRSGRIPILTGLERYAPEQKGKYLKLSEQDVNGQKAPSVELERDGKPVTAIVVGKVQGKRWVADARVLSAVKKLKPDAEVVFRAREDDGKLWLKEISPAPVKKAEADSPSPRHRAPRNGASRGARLVPAAKGGDEGSDRRADK